VKFVPPTPEGLAEAAAILHAGGVVAYPTETVYGLAVDPHSPSALRKLFQVKGRPDANPVLLIVADATQLAQVALSLSARAMHCVETFWPGPLSLVLPAVPGLPAEIAPQGKVCVRCPGSDLARALCAAFGAAITSTSANISGEPPATHAQAALEGVDIVVDGGALAASAPSTVYDPDADVVLREGAIASSLLK
jgi:L-threonylcarbamoyladenylate synthase